jgi:hypothetical protein
MPTNDVRRVQLEDVAKEAQQLYLAGRTGQRLAYKARYRRRAEWTTPGARWFCA